MKHILAMNSLLLTLELHSDNRDVIVSSEGMREVRMISSGSFCRLIPDRME